jgi:hypothetical protein
VRGGSWKAGCYSLLSEYFTNLLPNLALVCNSVVYFRVTGIWRNLGDRKPTKFGSPGGPQFGNLNG